MKKILIIGLIALIAVGCNQSSPSPAKKYIEWRSDNEIADAMVMKGLFHFVNIERQIAYTYFKGSLDYDSTLFGSHVILAWLTPQGDERKMHQDKARELVKNKNETSKLFVSLFDVPLGEGVRARRHELWSKMHGIEPDGGFIHWYYALTKPTPEERISELEVLLAKENHTLGTGHILNNLGYINYAVGNKTKAKSYFDEYIKLYPTGSNPYDSMGEYYYNEKDYDNSLVYYNKSVELFPGNSGGVNMIKEMDESGEPSGPHTSKEWQIWAYSSAAPSYIAENATILDPTMAVLREGNNGWTCLPANPRGMADSEKGWKDPHEAMPVCADGESMKWMQGYMGGTIPQMDRDGFMWMLHGDMGEDNTKPMVMAKSDAEDPNEWIESGPHLMFMPKDPTTIDGHTTNFNTGAPYVMWAGSPYRHLMIPVNDYYQYQPKQ